VSREEQPLRGKVALVTGAAGAIGAGVCRGLLQNGCRVAVTDVAKAKLEELVAELRGAASDGTSPLPFPPKPPSPRPRNPGGKEIPSSDPTSEQVSSREGCPPQADAAGHAVADRVVGVVMNVADETSVTDGFGEVIETWGQLDIVVVNAGIAHVSPIVDMALEDFRRLERVNVEGTLLTLREAGRRMVAQGTGGDIVLVSTKNVFMPGASFGAYSATKAAAHQLARIASLEFAPHGIRVNMVAPDAVFGEGERKSGLWTEVGPSRMEARGLDEEGLEEYYRNRNLLRARVTPDDVANAVLFFVTRQTPTTGTTIPVDGGLPDSTPR